jgi:tripartite-type tricarboxylate transporter receptor subunit TctC
MNNFPGGLRALLAASAAALFAIGVQAEDYPSKGIRLVVPYSPGGANDTTARLLGQKLAESMGQTVVIDNKPGASGMIAGEFVAKAPPDGYTIMVDLSSIAMNPALYPSIAYDVRTDLTPIIRAVNVLHVFLVNSEVPVHNVAELVALAKSRPGKLNYASPGTGGPQHVGVELLKRGAGIDMVHVPYKGGAPAMIALLANEVQLGLFAVSTSLPQIRAGKLRAIAVLGERRLKVLPDVPTMAEQGYAGFTTPWLGVFAPGRTPPAIVARLHAELTKALGSPEVRDKLEQQGLEVAAPNTSEAFAHLIDQEMALYGKVIRESGIKAE